MKETKDSLDPLEEFEAAVVTIRNILHRTYPEKSVRESDKRKIARWYQVISFLRLTGLSDKIAEREAELRSRRVRLVFDDIKEHVRAIKRNLSIYGEELTDFMRPGRIKLEEAMYFENDLHNTMIDVSRIVDVWNERYDEREQAKKLRREERCKARLDAPRSALKQVEPDSQ